MEKFFLKVLHEEPVAELSLHELVGGGECGCNDTTTYCGCNGVYCGCNGTNCPCNFTLYCNANCPFNCYFNRCPPDSSIDDGEIKPIYP